jgi:hypothetical protein
LLFDRPHTSYRDEGRKKGGYVVSRTQWKFMLGFGNTILLAFHRKKPNSQMMNDATSDEHFRNPPIP